MRAAVSFSTSSPATWPKRSLMLLKSPRSTRTTAPLLPFLEILEFSSSSRRMMYLRFHTWVRGSIRASWRRSANRLFSTQKVAPCSAVISRSSFSEGVKPLSFQAARTANTVPLNERGTARVPGRSFSPPATGSPVRRASLAREAKRDIMSSPPVSPGWPASRVMFSPSSPPGARIPTRGKPSSAPRMSTILLDRSSFVRSAAKCCTTL